MFDPVGSTSWHNRHKQYFDRLNQLLVEAGAAMPTIMVVGPGAITRFASPFLNDASRPASTFRKLVGDAARYADQLVRRIPFMPLRSLEPAEVGAALSMPHRLVVVDRSKRALAAVARQLPDAQCIPCDVVASSPGVEADVIIAFNVVCRLDDPAAGIANIVQCLRPGGLMLIDDRSARDHLPAGRFREISPKTHRLSE